MCIRDSTYGGVCEIGGGSADAQVNLGTLLLNGWGGREDSQRALAWFQSAAQQGNALALTKLGFMYEHGKGVRQDFIEAHKWYNLGGAYGEKMGAASRDELGKWMTSAQIAEAQQLARRWTPKEP